MKKKLFNKLFCAIALAGVGLNAASVSAQQNEQDVDVLVTSDNAYAFGFGRQSGIPDGNLEPGVWNTTAGEITGCSVGDVGPEEYTVVKADEDTYLYIIAWSDDAVYQGTMAQFHLLRDGDVVTTGDEDWEVFATGINYSSAGGPSLASINEQIALANAAAGDPSTSSVTWVDSDGEPDGIGAWAVKDMSHLNVCDQQMPRSAKWMWYDSDPDDNVDPFVFQSVAYHREYLIFRIPVSFQPLDVDVTPTCDGSSAELYVNVYSGGAIVDHVWYEFNNQTVDLCNGNCGADYATTIPGTFPDEGVITVYATSSDSTVYDDSDTQSWSCEVEPPNCFASRYAVEMPPYTGWDVVDCACLTIPAYSMPAWANNVTVQTQTGDPNASPVPLTDYPVPFTFSSGDESGSGSLDFDWDQATVPAEYDSVTYILLGGDCSKRVRINWWPQG